MQPPASLGGGPPALGCLETQVKPFFGDMEEKWRVLWALGWVAGWVGVFASKSEAQVVGERKRI